MPRNGCVNSKRVYDAFLEGSADKWSAYEIGIGVAADGVKAQGEY